MKSCYLLMLFTILSFSIYAQQSLAKKWDKRFGGAKDDELFWFAQTHDGGYLLGGESNSPLSCDKSQPDWDTTSFSTYDYWVIKIDSIGNKQWDARFGGYGNDLFSQFSETPDGGYILGGPTGSGMGGDKSQPGWGGWDFWIVKIDSLGQKQWDKRFGGNQDDFLWTIATTQDGGYILPGESSSPISGDKTQPNWDTSLSWADFWVVKIDSAGNKEWDKRYGGNKEEQLLAVVQTEDGYLLGGSSSSGVNGDKTQPNWDTTLITTDFWVVKIDSLGNKLWDKRYGGTDDEGIFSMQQTSDKGFILAGSSESQIGGDKTQPNFGGSDYWIVKIDSIGNKLWDKDYGGPADDELKTIVKTSDNGYLMAGNSESNTGGIKTENNLGYDQTWVVKTDSLGNKKWDKTIFTLESHEGWAIQTKDGCYAISNTTGGGIAGYKSELNCSDSAVNYWIVLFCDTILAGINDITDSVNLTIYPNPFTTDIAIALQKQNLQQADFTITNTLGQTIYTQHETNLSPAYTKMLDLSYLPNGVYLLQVVVDGEKITKQIVKQ